MVTKTIDIQNTDMSLQELIALLNQDTEVIITEDGAPVARLMSFETQPKQRIPGLHAGAMTMSDDFDDPLPDEFWLGNEV
jgi:antitoxin (DNA-binding transcriptional repressor) of toxin-antitoxin stability system